MANGKNNPVPERFRVTLTDSDNEDGVLGDIESVEVPQNVQASKDDKTMLQEVDIADVSERTSNVLQVVTDNAANCKAARKEVEKIKDVMMNHSYVEYYPRVEKIILARWEKMTIPLHCIGFSLSQRFYDKNYLEEMAASGVRTAFEKCMKERFDMLDVNKDGVLSRNELHNDINDLSSVESALQSKEEVNNLYNVLFEKFDTEKKGTLDIKQFNSLMKEVMIAKAHGFDGKDVRTGVLEDKVDPSPAKKACWRKDRHTAV
uniref:EF-hand domain-containing protein n=1 Tax=Lactuca sativa TaxID=4236 RepID=A0A9R1VH33_LACSA|nr:hypothetical protein LSAT_V11C500270080 [Lactuca sativa]